MSKKGPKILVIDIETSPLISYTWGIFDQNVALNQIIQDWNIISFAAKWLDEPVSKIVYMDLRNQKDIHDDRKLLKAMWKLLDEADVIITQNGKSFDEKKINARFILNGMQPPSSFKHVDTLRIAKKKFGFTSNKLEYMTDKLCTKYKKSKHKKYSGFELWRACMAGDINAWKEMEHYNKLDILSLEELYKKMRPWDNSLNVNVYHDLEHTVCSCGSTDFKRNGYAYTSVGKFQRYSCKSCGAEVRNRNNEFTKEKKQSLKVKV